MGASPAVSGTVRATNFDPKGEVDGLIIEEGDGLVQVNLGHGLGDQARALVGRRVTVQTAPEPKVAEHPRGDHPVFRLESLADSDGQAIELAARPHPPGHGPAGATGPVEVAGVVQRLNYAKHGEANGVVLDTGDFVHLKPDGMKQLGLQVGQRVTARGKAKAEAGASDAGGHVLDAETVNDVAVGPGKPH